MKLTPSLRGQMKFPPITLGQTIKVVWADSKSALGWKYDPGLQRKPGYIKTIGYAIQENDECITLSTSLGEHGESLDELSIPVGCIKELEVLDEQV